MGGLVEQIKANSRTFRRGDHFRRDRFRNAQFDACRKHYLLEVPAEATQVVVKRGRHIHSFKSDQTGVTDISLPGNHYRVVIVTPLGQTKYKAYVKKVRDKSFQLKEDH